MASTLRFARKRAGLSVPALALAVGVNRSTISRLENGLRLPFHETAQRLEKALGCALKFTRAVSR
jgi:transcriptional regulator with XRE-family HTH domain